MKSIKKMIALLLVLFAAFNMLAGCGGNDDGDDTAEPSFVILDESVATEEFAIGFRKGDELCEQVNAALKVLKADGTVEEISSKWFGSDITTIEADESALDNMDIEEGRTFILGLDDSFPPMGYRDDDNNIVGFDIDLATAMCEYLGWELTLQPIDWSAKEIELNAGNIDCIWNGMTLTEERAESMSCSEPYMANEQVLVVLSDSGYSSQGDLSGKKLALQSGSSAEEALAAVEDFKDSLGSVDTYSNNLECFMDLEQGGVDVVLVDSIVANWYIATGNAPSE